jgi:hypothetical protein
MLKIKNYIRIYLLQIVFIFSVLCIPYISFGQVFGNEWIVDGQKYYKIPVANTGMYAVTFNQLQSSGVPASYLTNKDNLQLFHRGVEQAINISNDSVYFYGEINDGTLDSLLYEPNIYTPTVSSQPHKYYNLYSDTSAYFLTWSAGVLGKRMAISNISSTASADNYHLADTLVLYTEDYEMGYRHSAETYMTTGDIAEGWCSNAISYKTIYKKYTQILNVSSVYITGPDAQLEILFIGRNGFSGTFNHRVDILIGDPSSPDLIFNVPPFSGYDVFKHSISIPLSYISSGTFKVTIQTKANPEDNPSYVSYGYMKLTYPQNFTMAGKLKCNFNTLPNVSNSRIQISEFPSNGVLYDISDRNNVQIVNHSSVGNLVNAYLTPSDKGHTIFAVGSSAILIPNLIKLVDLSSYNKMSSSDYIIISNTKIMEGAREYAAYRASNSGGSYDTLLADVNKLYNLYSYGERTPVAIKRFIAHAFHLGDPKYLFIIGKGLAINYNSPPYYRTNPDFYVNHPDPGFRRENLVPCYGLPGSDLLYSVGLDNHPKYVPALATGRLPAKTVYEIRDYLNKIKEHESTPNALWRKNLIHLSGGNYVSERLSFYNNVVTLKNIAEDTVFGGKVVKIFTKKGNDAVDNELISSVATEINKGVSYVTFFGHSAPNITDLDIGFASHDFYGYKNKGKYPLLFINGCSAANMFGRFSFAEDWVLTPNRGALLTIGHSDAGYASELYNYSTTFYRNAFQKRSMIGKSTGDVHLQTINEFYNSFIKPFSTPPPIALTTIHQMILQGDPAVRIYNPLKPDYQIDDSKLSIKSLDPTNKVVTAISDSFAISIIVSNLGVDFGDSLQIKVKRTVNGKVILYGPVSYKNVKYQDTINFVIKSRDISTYGENIFEVVLDPNDYIPEMNEINNTGILRFFIPLSGIQTLFPKEFSIVNSNPVTFIAQSTNLLVTNKDYYIELDTTYLFNSSYRKDAVINSGSLIKWPTISLPILQDSLVYYWRIRYNEIAFGEDTLYGQSSFIYINGSPEGWSQSEFPQFFKDNLNKIDRIIPNRTWEFSKSITNISVQIAGNSYVHTPPDPLFDVPFKETSVILGGQTYVYRSNNCSSNVIIAATFDKQTGQPYTPYPSENGGNVCGLFDSRINIFPALGADPTLPKGGGNQADLIAYIDAVPNGDYVLLLNSGNPSYSNWGADLKTKLANELGAQKLGSLIDNMAYLILAKKGDPTPIFEEYRSSTELLKFQDTIYGSHDRGYITSTLIGPANSWGTFYRNVSIPEIGLDKYQMKIIGVDLLGNNIDTLSIPAHDTLDLTTIPTLDQYPYIRLLTEIKDTANLTAPQLKRWQVIYSGVPEGTMNPNLVGISQYNSTTKQEGDTISLCYAFENISNYDFSDSLTVRYTITNSNTGATIKTVKVKSLKQDSVVTFCAKFPTKGLEGNNIIQAYVNPKILKEEYYNNNIIETSVKVEKDKIHPVLDVVFDGVHILDGDIVSPNPMITITLYDENKFMLRNSPDDIEVFIQRPGESIPQKISQGDPAFVSARQVGKDGKNVYQIDYNPQNLPNGIYTIVVRGKDLAGNISGVQDYTITFEVINESTITNFYPYPNPFSTSTRFVFTITGSEVPQDMKIQIMTVTGKVVREITKEELGPIRVGNNKTEYAWDGRDEFGDKLANGVYLYRVILKNGGEFKHRDTAGDKAFKKNFGKLYILR